MKLKVGSNDIFDAPEGKYTAHLESVGEPKKRINRPCSSQVRLQFRATASSGKQYLVAQTFCADLSYGSELYQFLDSWLDGDFERLTDDDGELDLDLLLKRKADILVTHYHHEKYEKPFVKIDAIYPQGRIID